MYLWLFGSLYSGFGNLIGRRSIAAQGSSLVPARFLLVWGNSLSEEIEGLVIYLGEHLEFSKVDPALARFALRDEGLGLA